MVYINGRFLTQDITGVQRFAYELCLQLSRLRTDIIILVPSVSLIKKDYLINELTIFELKGGGGHYWEQFTLPFFLKKNKESLLVNLCNTGPAFYKNQIITQHDISYIRFPESFSRKFRFFYMFLTPLLLRNSRAIVTVSNFSKKEISSHYKINKSKIHVIHNAVGHLFSDVVGCQLNNEEYFLTVSSVNYHKNIHGLVRALVESNLNIKLKVIGGKTVAFRSIHFDFDDPRIVFLGRVTDVELAHLYKGAKAFIFPSFYEGFGIPPLEAQSCSCPVISSDRAAMKEVLSNSAFYFNPDATSEIVRAIKLINDKPSIRKQLIEKGKINVQRYSWLESANKLDALIKKFS
ncbi:glycosyltransferase family 4 protein [Raoultella planticola]|uniref:glycosyltransferase family 4 protein n=1 Tax=Raoultella planticola TaxID=575 RepID=UPI001C9DF4AE|nr:glycosyltransferase family 1 protein [Raoultella planticola]MDM9678475.1 glycosyltransferase family 1 protein [Raoultella planticola]QZS65880.1 glycosyltransferase family 4 protein [Raoultella planticola]HDG9809446.1 glycosyltransferase family 4 protein [Raoultella planticola]